MMTTLTLWKWWRWWAAVVIKTPAHVCIPPSPQHISLAEGFSISLPVRQRSHTSEGLQQSSVYCQIVCVFFPSFFWWGDEERGAGRFGLLSRRANWTIKNLWYFTGATKTLCCVWFFLHHIFVFSTFYSLYHHHHHHRHHHTYCVFVIFRYMFSGINTKIWLNLVI